MFPQLAMHNLVYGLYGYSKPIGYSHLWCSNGIQRSDVFNMRLGKLGIKVSLPTLNLLRVSSCPMLVSAVRPAMRHFVGHIVFVSSQIKMVWVHTHGVVTRVKALHSLRNLTSPVFKGESVRVNVSVVPNITISLAPSSCSSPSPTSSLGRIIGMHWATFINLFQKPNFYGFSSLWMSVHRRNRRQAKVLSACSWPRLLDDGKMFLVRNTFIGYNRAT